MTTKKKPEILMIDETPSSKNEELPVVSRTSRHLEHKRIRKINPLGMRVLVQIRKDPNQTEGGLYLPEGAKHNMQESLVAEVLEVASATDDETEEEHNVSGVPLGALVLILKNAGVKVPWDDNLRIVDTKEVLAVISEISIT